MRTSVVSCSEHGIKLSVIMKNAEKSSLAEELLLS